MSLSVRIRDAFKNTARPSDDAIFQGDYEGADSAFYGHSWEEISVADLNYHSLVLTAAFTPHAFVYFLPAFMIASLENRQLEGIKDNVLYRLCPPKNDPGRPSYQAWWSLLSVEQRLCLIAFLEEFRSENLEHYERVIAALRKYVDG